MRTNQELVNYLRAYEHLRSPEVIAAFESIDRAFFLPEDLQEQAYLDIALPTSQGQTISAPSVVALMSEALQPKRGQKLLEVGTGSGYQSALLAHAIGPKGSLTTIERFSELSSFAQKTIKKYYPELAKCINFVVADGSVGHNKSAPFDAILVTCGAPSVPKSLFAQLKEGGRMVIPLGGPYAQDLALVRKVKGKMVSTLLFPVMFVPLVGEEGFPESSRRRDTG